MSDIVEFVEARLSDLERLAQDAVPADYPGHTWHWVTVETDTPVPAGDIDEALQHQNLALRSVEQFPSKHVGLLPAFLISNVDEMHAGAADHIAANDPAFVLAEVKSLRAIVDRWKYFAGLIDSEPNPEKRERLALTRHGLDSVLHDLALIWQSHPDYDESWRP